MFLKYLKRKRTINKLERIENLNLTKEECKALQGIITLAPLLIFMAFIFHAIARQKITADILYRRARGSLIISFIIFVIAIIAGVFAGLWGILPLLLFVVGMFYTRRLMRKAQYLESIEHA